MGKFDTTQGILVIVRRGRGGRGYTVAPVDSPTDVGVCADVNQVGDAIVEMLDDENQPRIDIDALISAAQGDDQDREESKSSSKSKKADIDKSDLEEDEEGEEEEEGGEDEEEEEDEPWYKAKDPADAFLIGLVSKAIEKGQSFGYKNRSKKKRRRRKRA